MNNTLLTITLEKLPHKPPDTYRQLSRLNNLQDIFFLYSAGLARVGVPDLQVNVVSRPPYITSIASHTSYLGCSGSALTVTLVLPARLSSVRTRSIVPVDDGVCDSGPKHQYYQNSSVQLSEAASIPPTGLYSTCWPSLYFAFAIVEAVKFLKVL